MITNSYNKATDILLQSNYTAAFTGAGISVESGIPPFRGENGLWNKYDPGVLDLDHFYKNPQASWEVIKEIFYDYFGTTKPNPAHNVLGQMENDGMVKEVITQNIDNLHQAGGSKTVHEFHGNSHRLTCMECSRKYGFENVNFENIPPRCDCGGLLKPDFIFFGEMIPQDALQASQHAAENAEVFIVIGSTGEVYPAAQIPFIAKQNGAKIIEVNIKTSLFTNQITDILLLGKASQVMQQLYETIKSKKNQ